MSLRLLRLCAGIAVAVASCKSPDEAAPPAASVATAPATVPTDASPASRVVEIAATGGAFTPSNIEAQPGERLTLRFTREDAGGCLSKVVLASIGVAHQLPMHQPVDVQVTAPADGALGFECGMGMARGRVVVGGSSAASAASAAPSADPRAHADHEPRHGGVLTMEGDHHVEIVVAQDGAIALYVSDAVRTPLPATDVTGNVTVSAPGGKTDLQRLTLAASSPTAPLTVKGPPPDQKREYSWDLLVRGQKLQMTLAVPPGGTAAFTAGAGGGSTPRGVVRKVAEGHAEVAVASDGAVTLKMLDASRGPTSARGVGATIRRLPSGPEVTLTYDEKLDALLGRIEPGGSSHLDTAVRITPAGGKATELRVSFHLEKSGASH